MCRSGRRQKFREEHESLKRVSESERGGARPTGAPMEGRGVDVKVQLLRSFRLWGPTHPGSS